MGAGKRPVNPARVQPAPAVAEPVSVDPGLRPAWLRFVLPSASDLIFTALLVTLTYGALSTRLLGDAGIGWHIRNGQQILQTGAMPRTDSFSSTMAGKPWYAWEWLYDAAIASVHQRLGLEGVVFAGAFLIALPFVMVFRLLISRGTNLFLAVFLTVLAISASTIHFFARPHVVTWIFTVVFVSLLDAAEKSSTGRIRGLYFLPGLMILWANLHGGFLTGLILLGLYGLAAAWDAAILRDAAARPRVRRIVQVFALSLAATLINPYGYKLYTHIYEYLSNRFLMDHIDEFQSPNFHGLAQQCFGLLLLLAALTLAVSKQNPRTSHLLLSLFAVLSGLYASRNLPVSSLLLAFTIAAQVTGNATETDDKRPPRWLALGRRLQRRELQFRGHALPVAVCLVTLWICAHGGKLVSRRVIHADFDAQRFPVAAVNVIEQKGIAGPIFCPDSWGGYLIYRLYPRTRVAVDDRHDLYGESFLRGYLKITRAEPGWQQALAEWNINWILIPTNSSFASGLDSTSGWTSVYRDGVAELFQRREN